MDIKQKVGGRIRELRKVRGLSQERLANEAEVDRTYVTDVEAGRRNVSLEILYRLLNGLKISFADFFSTKDFKK